VDPSQHILYWREEGANGDTLGQLQIILQAANNHTRPGGTPTPPGSEWETYFASPKDWYWLARLGFFF